MMACIEAGAVGRNIMKTLEKYGLDDGHEARQRRVSTLGGWTRPMRAG